MFLCCNVFVSPGECGSSHHPAHVPVLQKDDGILFPRKERGGGGSCWWGRQVPNGHYWYVLSLPASILSRGCTCTSSYRSWVPALWAILTRTRLTYQLLMCNSYALLYNTFTCPQVSIHPLHVDQPEIHTCLHPTNITFHCLPILVWYSIGSCCVTPGVY